MSGLFESVASLPRVLQLGVVGVLGGFSALSVAGLLWPRFGKRIFDPERDPSSFDHLVSYTLVPLVLFGAALFTVHAGWQPGRPLLDGMSAPLWRAVAGLILAFGLAGTAQVLRRRMDISDGRKLTSWLPLLLFLGALVLMILSGQLFHRHLGE